ncbi:DinB family protein [Mucilaginibacter segetis]|uniref:DinB family protein n=1 Tax=Mucilaginibacter segetis TaxID=2793071 RepID=A0A934UMM0_9SPHI|nr:DinB family protein [Mucilaginibacter segetis]MBK0379808.1 DinB family protein [Mucilaginibacter segetis]
MEMNGNYLQPYLQQVLAGYPWYGTNVYDIIGSTTFEAAYEKPGGSVHNIAGILLHMLNWTIEVSERIQGKEAGMPEAQNWPDPGTPDEQKWQTLINDFKLANTRLAGIIQDMPADTWDKPINDTRDEPGAPASYAETINGLIQHHIYHAGQIALLNRIING